MKDYKNTQCFFVILIISLILTSCSSKYSGLRKQYGNDTEYFMALTALNQKDEKKAAQLFAKSSKKGSSLIARRSAEQLASLGNIVERNKKKIKFYRTYSDEEALLTVVKELFENDEYAKIIQLTSTQDVALCNNDIAYLRCISLQKKNDSHFEEEFNKWYFERSFTANHYKFYCTLKETASHYSLRAAVYKQDYNVAYDIFKTLVDTNSEIINSQAQLISDGGKACLYGSDNYIKNGYLFDNIALSTSDECKFTAYFYSGRLFSKEGEHQSLASGKFLRAMECAPDNKKFDNALWYYINSQLSISITQAINAIKQYRTEWHEKNYFDDIFDTLSVRLLSQHLWQEFLTTAELSDGYASDEVTAKYCYIAARLIETGFIKNIDNNEDTIKSLYTRALSSGTDLYYRLAAAAKLNISSEDFANILYKPTLNQSFKSDKDVEKLLEGYADFGFPEMIYSEWLKTGDKAGIDCIEKVSAFLQDCGDEENNYYTKSLRMAAKKVNYNEQIPDKAFLELVYPQNFHSSVSSTCIRFNIPEYLLYALIRSESFFDPKVMSHAGAIGLTQLMESTASDVARKLKFAEYNLHDSATNILFGGYYLEEMRRRLEGSSIYALFAYNGGITRVRSWVKSANLEFGTDKLPKDLFLEALPFAETREYGRKVVSAAAIYGYLYYDKSISEVISEIMN